MSGLLTFFICAAAAAQPCTARTALRHYQCEQMDSDIFGRLLTDCPRPEDVAAWVGFYGLPKGNYVLVYGRMAVASY